MSTRTGKVGCTLVSADDDSMTCQAVTPRVLNRDEIVRITVSHRGRSTLVGMGAGAGVGFIVCVAGGTNSSGGFFGPNFLGGALAAVCAVIGGLIGAAVGAVTDFTSGGPLYTAP